MPEAQQSIDLEAFVDRARALWRDASARVSTARVELFAKATLRFRVTRDLGGAGATFDSVHESGIAVRTLRAGNDHAGFAAASGLSADVVRWVVDMARTDRAHASASAPGPSESIAAERWDLDAAVALPNEESLTAGLIARPSVEWIEAGTTLEVLIGAEGWLAARSRHRLWALGGGPTAKLVAQRGFSDWGQLLDDAESESLREPHRDAEGLGVLVLTRDAAASVVSALVDAFHGTASTEWAEPGEGWDLTDDPMRPEGLAGGSFDDAGFPAIPRVLAESGVWVGRLGGPGAFRRASFREPPVESATNLVMPAGTAESIPDGAAVARRCRVLRLSPGLWVLELDLQDVETERGPDRRWVRVRPRALLAACTARLGGVKVTSSGPIVPALRFDGLSER